MGEWTPYVGAICKQARTHHPAIKPIAGPVRVMRMAGDGHACWIQPLGPVRVRQLRNGREVRETPNYEALVSNDQLAPMSPNEAAAALQEA
jgi:hypothetical protein